MKKRVLISTTILMLFAITAGAADKIQFKNEVRIGIGGIGSEKAFFPDSDHLSYLDRPSLVSYLEKQNHRYIPHIFAEYDRNIRDWFSLGGQVDFSGFSWDNNSYSGGSDAIVSTEKQNCFNIAIQAFCRFNWLRHEHLMLYSSIGLGTDINTGTETDPYGHKTLVGFAITPVLIGVRLGWGQWFGALELGGINALKSTDQILLLGARTLSLSAGFRF